MNVPAATDPVWKNLITGQLKCDFEFLATKIFLGRSKYLLAKDSSPQALAAMAAELREIFAGNAGLNVIQRDLQRIVR